MLRPARAADAAAITALVQAAYAVFVPRLGQKPPPMADDYAAVIASGAARVWEEEGQVIGLLVLRPGPAQMRLENIAIAPGAQGRGLGRVLVAAAEGVARQHGHDRVQLFTHPKMVETIAFYHRLGFQTVAEDPPNPHRIALEKHLDAG